ncbi:hypothetical protein [uncultured Desulfuromonas sp.]|uniref:hypothetical protein n=1 Tax=uncultured Desulfuromonas sp. TaxID=181013 RepID=UPI002617F49A|nr:hypothetical protein [uncultured Desulfuromonas sp.]
MARRWVVPLLLVCLLSGYFLFQKQLWEMRAEVRRSAVAGYVIPSKFSRVLALEHKGLISDFFLLKTITFFGERVIAEQPLSDEDWRFIVGSLDAVTDLDPYFLDPYLLGEGLLTWESEKVEEANRLLEKGRKYRTWDWQMPFYLGFNHFYFLGDNEKGAEYLLEAGRLPDSLSFLPDLASRIGYYGGRSQDAAVFLKGILAQTDDRQVKMRLEKRLLVLERSAFLEKIVETFREEKGRMPVDIEELIVLGYIKDLPEDPYGGRWVIMDSGRVFSTSKFVQH